MDKLKEGGDRMDARTDGRMDGWRDPEIESSQRQTNKIKQIDKQRGLERKRESERQPPFGPFRPSVGSLCYPFISTTHLSTLKALSLCLSLSLSVYPSICLSI